MTITSTNTYTTPASTAKLTDARINVNNSLDALLTNFYSASAPTLYNFSSDGTSIDPPLGTLFISANTNSLYRKVDSSSLLYANPTGTYGNQNFTRRGVSYRVEPNAVAANANIGSYEIGELFYAISEDSVYYKNATNQLSKLIGVGGSNVTIENGSVTPAKLSSNSSIQYDTVGRLTLGNTYIDTSANLVIFGGAAQSPLHIKLYPSTHATSRRAAIEVDDWAVIQDINLTGAKDFALYQKSTSTNRFYVSPTGNVGFSTVSPIATVDVSGTFNTSKANVVSQTLTETSPLVWNTVSGRVATLSLTGNITINNPINLKVGTYVLIVINTSDGTKNITWAGDKFKWTAGVTPPASNANNARDIYSFIYDGTYMYGAQIPDIRV
ncbi:MAG: hypothetical protein ACKN9V_02820 [Pseudomonadota bacterium]